MSKIYSIVVLFTLVMVSVFHQAKAEIFDPSSRHEDIQNYAIVDTGNFEKISRPGYTSSSYDILKLKSSCFEVIGYTGISEYNGNAGFVIVNRDNIFKIALLTSGIGGVKVRVLDASSVECPKIDFERFRNEQKKILNEIKRMQEESQKELERLRQKRQ